MIIVVEGISASGKSTWCARLGADHVVPETGGLAAPDHSVGAQAAATFWVDENARRWRAALAMESANNPAICDTDPLKLHYAWSLWQIGEAPEEQWLFQRSATRQAIVDRRIGFADAYIVRAIDPQIARRRREDDKTRQRRNFELHLRLQPSLLAWYRTLGAIRHKPVLFGFPERIPSPPTSNHDDRYDVTLFDTMMASLPRRQTG